MTEQSMTASTYSMTARTQTLRSEPDRSALAARSLAAVERIADPERRSAAFSRHMAQFPPVIARL